MKGRALTPEVSKNNYLSYLWHAIFMALALNLMDVDTILPAMVIDAGGSSIHIGILTAIMLGGATVTQLVFSPFLNNRVARKKYLLLAIMLRVLSLAGLAGLLYLFSNTRYSNSTLTIIFVVIAIFSFSGAFAGLSYTDILGKSMLVDKRKSFFSMRQIIMSIGVFISAIIAARVLVLYDYPNNYALLFLLAAALLWIASFGFWKIIEVSVPSIKIEGIRAFGSVIRKEFRTNRKLRNYILLVNSLGLSLSLMPFLILYSKVTFNSGSAEIGQYLFYKVIAGVLVGSLLFYFSKRVRYNYLLYTTAAVSVFIPLHLLFFPEVNAMVFYFFGGGLIFTLYKISIEGILLEVSTDQNRVLYAGISGASSLLPAVFPIIGGIIIQQFGFSAFFVLFVAIVMFSFWFIHQLDCKK